MIEISKIRKLSLWIFFLPLIAINLCLIISVNPDFLDETIFQVDQIGRSGFSIPYLDGSLSISRASRTFPQYLIFKPAMIITGILLFYYWNNYNRLICNLRNTENFKYKFRLFGILSAVFLIIHSIFLGVKFDIQLYKLFRRVVLLLFIIFELVAQGMLVNYLYNVKDKVSEIINKKILILKIFLVSILVIVAIASLPILVTKGNTHFKHALEWNYFVGVIAFYLMTYFFWRRTT
tara:strand:+ start:101 stop:805 length:705 start_codon:yes stop_codon:yes gene_type:complete